MKGFFNILFGLILIVLVGCQNNSEKLIQTKISNVDNTILLSQPHKSDKHERACYASQSTIKDIEYTSETDLPIELNKNENLRFSSLSDEVALAQLFSELSEPTQQFVINPKKDTLLVCAKGTIVEIKVGSLVYKNGKPVLGLTRFEVAEYLNKTEFVYASLSTNTNKGDLLESGGTLLLKAYSGKEEVFIAKGKSIQFQVPTNTVKQNMELFSGIRDVHGSMKWYIIGTKKNKKPTRKIVNEKNKTQKNQVIIEERILVKYQNGEEIYSKNYSNPERNSFYKKEKLDSVSVYFEIDEKNTIKKSWSKRNVQKGIKKPSFTSWRKGLFNRRAYDVLIEGLEDDSKINLNKVYYLNSGFPTIDWFSLDETWLKTKKEKKNRDKVLTVSIQRICVYSDTLEKLFLEEKQQDLQRIETRLSIDGSTNVKESELQYYIFNTALLGWINVDRFLPIKGAKSKFVLENTNLENSKVSLVFKNHDTVLPGFVENGKVNFDHIPLGEDVTIVAIKIEKGVPMLYLQEIKTERGKFNQPIEFKAISFANLKEEMKKINGANK